MSPDPREARIEAEAVTDAAVLIARAKAVSKHHGRFNPWGDAAEFVLTGRPRDILSDEAHAELAATIEAARQARASNDSGAVEATLITATELCARCSERVFVTMRGPMVPHQCWQRAPQPAPDRILQSPCDVRIAHIEAALDTLFAGVTGLREDWDRALIAAAKAWNREGE